jgi:hypothetical protein
MSQQEGLMKKLVLMMIALLALFTFIRDYSDPLGVATQNAQLEAGLPN